MRQLPLPGDMVKMSNALARARWQPNSIWESRIIALVASKVHESDEDFFTYRIPVAELTGMSDENLRGNQYREIVKSIEHLGKATIKLEGRKARNFRQYNIFAMCGYEDGHLIAEFHPDLKPHFLVLKKHFTIYSLFEFLLLPSTYSQRMFEILKSWANCPEVVISMADLHEILDTPDSFRANFKDFRRRVLEKAHKDIAAKTSLFFEWEPIMQGRSVGSIRFVFSKGKTARISEEKNIKLQRSDIRRRNAFMVAAVECAGDKIAPCPGNGQKTEVCGYCREFGILK